jgi:trimethylamine--corrinoid protein Co-methyltransferase
MTDQTTRRRVGGSEVRHAQRNKRATGCVDTSLRGGTYKPLSDRDIERVHHTALDVLLPEDAMRPGNGRW